MDGDRVTVPAKDPRLVSVIVEVPDSPGGTESEEGLDEILKSGAWFVSCCRHAVNG